MIGQLCTMHAIGQITFQSLPLTGMKTKGKRSQNPDISLSLEIGKNRTYSHPTKEGDFIQSFLYTLMVCYLDSFASVLQC